MWLHALGLDERRTVRPAQMSGGERQRLAFARAAVAGHRLVIADEPTAQLDSTSAARGAGRHRRARRTGAHDDRRHTRPTCSRSRRRSRRVAGRRDLSDHHGGDRLSVIDRSGRLQLPPELESGSRAGVPGCGGPASPTTSGSIDHDGPDRSRARPALGVAVVRDAVRSRDRGGRRVVRDRVRRDRGSGRTFGFGQDDTAQSGRGMGASRCRHDRAGGGTGGWLELVGRGASGIGSPPGTECGAERPLRRLGDGRAGRWRNCSSCSTWSVWPSNARRTVDGRATACCGGACSVCAPLLLVADEPTAHQDERHADQVMSMLAHGGRGRCGARRHPRRPVVGARRSCAQPARRSAGDGGSTAAGRPARRCEDDEHVQHARPVDHRKCLTREG